VRVRVGAPGADCVGMDPTVLAGAIEFSPAEIALFVAVLVAASLVVTSPGWLVLSIVMGRRPASGATPGRRWAARVGGAAAGLAICAAAGSIVGLVPWGGVSLLLTVPVGWAACWALAAVLNPGRPAPAPTATTWTAADSTQTGPTLTGPTLTGWSAPPPEPPATGEGWGR